MTNIFEKYQIYLYAQKINVPARYWLATFFLISAIIGGVISLLSVKFGVLVFVVILDLGVGIPIFLYNKHVTTIEKYWPDSLRLVADTMKAGSSFDYALREAASADLGPLSFEFNETIRRLEMGDTTQDALNHMSLRIDSKIVKRTITLIRECLRTGAPLADVLDEIANDTKYMFRIKKTRITKTTLQVIFIFVAGGVVAPFIFGMSGVLTHFLTDIAISSGVATSGAIDVAIATQTTILFLLDLYIIIVAFGASAMVSLMRNGTLTNMFLYFPILVVLSFVIYTIAQFALTQVLAGVA
jgi:pilus assembly protein TadC